MLRVLKNYIDLWQIPLRTEKMRLLFICNEYPPAQHGGIGTFVFTLARSLAAEGIYVEVLGLDRTQLKIQRRLEQGVWVNRLAPPWKGRSFLHWGRYDVAAQLFERIYLSQMAKNLCARQKVDLVESYDWSGPLWFHPGCRLLVRMHGAHSAHALYEGRRSLRFVAYAEKKNLKMADALIGVSRHISELTLRAAKLETRDFQVIHNGVDTSIFFPGTDTVRSESEILFVGTVNRRKKIYEFFAAIPFVLESVPHAKFTVIGRLPASDPDRKKLLDELYSLVPVDKRGAITFTDVRPYEEMPSWYRKAACVVFPSLAEAFGLICVEAMACGTPVVMTSRASGPEIVEDGVSGILCEPTDTQKLAASITMLLKDRALRQNLSKNAVEKVGRDFEIRRQLNANLQVYSGFIS